MTSTLRIILLAIGCLLALYFNAFYLILLFAFIYGYVSDSDRSMRSTMVAFLTAFLVWTLCLYIKDASFFRSPSALLGNVLGGLPSWLIPLIGGIVGGVLALIGSMAGQFLSPRVD